MIHILIIDDSIFTCNMISKILSDESTQLIAANTAAQAFELLKSWIPDVILLDMVLPDMEGYQVCSKLKAMRELENVPIIFLTSNNDENSIVRGFEVGATDYIAKPFGKSELKARIACHAQNKQMAEKLYEANQEMKRMMEELRLQGFKDPLTNIYNRRYFLEHFVDWKEMLVKAPLKSYLYLIDVDKFKQVNDTYGHTTGDYVLITAAQIIRENAAVNSVTGRWGGDEFLAISFCISEQKALEMGNNIQRSIAEYPFLYDGVSFSCSVTIGVAEFDPQLKIEDNLNKADKALYAGKDRGRNCCVSEMEINRNKP